MARKSKKRVQEWKQFKATRKLVKLPKKEEKIAADQKEDVVGNNGEKVVTPEEKAYVENTGEPEPELELCPHKTIRNWPDCFEDCDYAGTDECPHYKSEPKPTPAFDPQKLIDKILKKYGA